jgi:deoxyribodipyrimidine photo-lyase
MEESATRALVWFREDLRIADNPALHAAARHDRPVLAIYVNDTSRGASREKGGAARWWLHHALASLSKNLEAKGGRLDLFEGDAAVLVPQIAAACQIDAIFWNRRYDAKGRAQDERIETHLARDGRRVETFNGKLIAEPQEIVTKAGEPFRVFTPFWRALQARDEPPSPLPAPRNLTPLPFARDAPKRMARDDLALLPTKPDWAGGLRKTWTPGEAAARKRLRDFLDDAIAGYADERDRPDSDATSRLSPYLASGELSARQVWHAARHAAEDRHAIGRNVEKFLSEIGWREFSYHLLFHHPDLATKNFNPAFDAFPWAPHPASHLHAWQKGRTGYPLVDAGMRQLWQTGWMHNRVRMIVGSFLVKHLRIDWRKGEDWFWDTLCDADPANNAASWQWIAGSGADAAPYFRIFNPVLQGEKFDPDGTFVKRFVPELRNMPATHVHRPWTAPPELLDKASLRLGRDYPVPIVDHLAARAAALSAFEKVKG